MAELNETIHQTVRLRIMAALVTLEPADEVDFSYLRSLLEVTDGNLGAHLRKLEEAGFIAVNKTFIERKPRSSFATALLVLCWKSDGSFLASTCCGYQCSAAFGKYTLSVERTVSNEAPTVNVMASK